MFTQRRFTRWVLHKNAKFRQGKIDSPYVDCIITDLSFKGAKISTLARIPRDAFTRLSIILSEDVILNVEAWVVWQKRVDRVNFYGMYFSKIQDSDKEKIYRFICSSYPKQLSEKLRGLPPEEEGKDMEDRRIFQRFPTKRRLRFLDLVNGWEGQGITIDLSAKGVGLRTDRELKERSALEIWLGVSDKEEPIYERGEVVWSKKIGPGSFSSGINLEKANLMGLARLLHPPSAGSQ